MESVKNAQINRCFCVKCTFSYGEIWKIDAFFGKNVLFYNFKTLKKYMDVLFKQKRGLFIDNLC
ncbi:hypothetical protein H9X83_09630 [Anaerotignum lactatifermentans]|uniref:Uncharacterized protein n=1 Tax=Anaerotignum lactatifermentans TaxID=160404 RepID=A0ABS2GCH9_9FIRM|nr:hypothetical protein [Anaerotignum lactatifermentans]